MTMIANKKVCCAIYTRVSTEAGLDQDFNSLDAQYDAAQSYIRSQAHAGWTLIRTRYDDGGFSGGSTDRPALQQLIADIKAHKIKVVVVYKVDRLTRSLADFAKLVELFDAHGVSFVSVTQQFNTTTSMGRADAECSFVDPLGGDFPLELRKRRKAARDPRPNAIKHFQWLALTNLLIGTI